MDRGSSFDGPWEVIGGEDLYLAVEIGKVRGGNRSVWEAGMKRAELPSKKAGTLSFIRPIAVSSSNTAQCCAH